MKKTILFLLFLFAALRLAASDPFCIAVLDNGLTVITFRNTDAPRIMTYIAVRAGSVNDPADSTGLAHYFEHMMFKGSERIASLDWAKEKPLLDKTAELFEQYRKEKDPEKRKAIYAEIDRVSGQAAQYANDEYWSLVRQMGATGTNAFTAQEITAYENDIPAGMLDRFLTLEAERFSNVALRRFHTELETVYEEFNRTQDNADRQIFNTMTALLYGAESPCGRPVIGLPEHLKNPSIRDVETFFRTYYIPSNMVVILSGDLDHEKAVQSVKNTFGKLPGSRKKIPALSPPPPMTAGKSATIYSRESGKILLAWRFPKNRETDYLFSLLFSVLKNGRCGLLDAKLIQPQKVLSANAGTWGNQFDNILLIEAKPKTGQTLEEVRSLIMAEIDAVKKGAFDPAILSSVTNNDRFELMQMLEERGSAAEIALFSLFKERQTMADIYADLQKADTATVQMVADYAEKNLKYPVTVYRKTGEPENMIHAEKPPITPVVLSGKPSAFADELNRISAGTLPEVTVPDFSRIKENGAVYAVQNTVNDRFRLTLYLGGGTWDDPQMLIEHILAYGKQLGTEKRSLADFNRKLYELGLTMNFFCTDYESGITITGLQKHFTAAVELLKERITQAKADPAVWEKYVESVRQKRANAKKSPSALTDAALTCALYGNDRTNNPELYTMSSAELAKLGGDHPARIFRNLLNFRTAGLSYYGPEPDPDSIDSLIWEKDAFRGTMRYFDTPKDFQIRQPQENTVYILPLPDTAQVSAYLVRPDQNSKIPAETAFAALMSRYSGQLFFQELREKQSFGYIAGAVFAVPSIQPRNKSFFLSVIGTQPDKLTDAVTAMRKLTEQMPEDPHLFAASRQNVLEQYRAARVKPEDLVGKQMDLERLLRPMDQVKRDYDAVRNMTAENFFRQINDKLNSSRDLWIISGNLPDGIDGRLTDFGKVIYLSPGDILPD